MTKKDKEEIGRIYDEKFEHFASIISQSFTKHADHLEKVIDEKIDRRSGIILELLEDKFKIVVEGNNMTNEKLDRFMVETNDNFGQVNRRLIDLESDTSDIKKEVGQIKQSLIIKRIIEDVD